MCAHTIRIIVCSYYTLFSPLHSPSPSGRPGTRSSLTSRAPIRARQPSAARVFVQHQHAQHAPLPLPRPHRACPTLFSHVSIRVQFVRLFIHHKAGSVRRPHPAHPRNRNARRTSLECNSRGGMRCIRVLTTSDALCTCMCAKQTMRAARA